MMNAKWPALEINGKSFEKELLELNIKNMDSKYHSGLRKLK